MTTASTDDDLAAYLDELGRPPAPRLRRSDEDLARRLAEVRATLPATTDVVRRLHLTQERLDLEHELDERARAERLTELEAAFVARARRGDLPADLDRDDLRRRGVPPAVLRRAGL